SPSSLVFFRLGSPPHPSLPSFPTRRSSDLTPRGSVHESAFSFKRMSAWRYTLVVSGDSCPSQSAITERSTPWWRRSMAAACRQTCGVTFFRLSDGQLRAARWAYLRSEERRV